MGVGGEEDECGDVEVLADFGGPPQEAIGDDTRDGLGPEEQGREKIFEPGPHASHGLE